MLHSLSLSFVLADSSAHFIGSACLWRTDPGSGAKEVYHECDPTKLNESPKVGHFFQSVVARQAGSGQRMSYGTNA